CLGRLLRNAGTDVAQHDLLAVLDHDDGPGWQAVGRRYVGVGEVDFLAVVIQQFDHRAQILAAGTTRLRLSDHQRGDTGDVVDIPLHRHTFDEVLELDVSGNLRND